MHIYICMYIYVYSYIYIYINTYIYTYICIHIHIYICTHIHITHTHTYICTYIYINAYTYIHTSTTAGVNNQSNVSSRGVNYTPSPIKTTTTKAGVGMVSFICTQSPHFSMQFFYGNCFLSTTPHVKTDVTKAGVGEVSFVFDLHIWACILFRWMIFIWELLFKFFLFIKYTPSPVETTASKLVLVWWVLDKYVTRITQLRYMTHLYRWHDPPINVTRLIHIFDMTYLYKYSFLYMTRPCPQLRLPCPHVVLVWWVLYLSFTYEYLFFSVIFFSTTPHPVETTVTKAGAGTANCR